MAKTASFETTVTVVIAQPAVGVLRAMMREARDRAVEALRDPDNAPGRRVASRPGETAEQYAVRAVERTSRLVDEFGGDGDAAAMVSAPRSVLLAAIDAALRGPHPSATLRALIELRRTVMSTEEDPG